MINRYFLFKDLPSSFEVGENESLNIFTILNNDFEGVKNLKINLLGKKSKFNLKCAILLKSQKKVIINSQTFHKAINSYSRVEIRSLLKDYSHLSFSGVINIKKGAYKSDAYLKHNTFLFSDTASVETSPKLEIGANDVKASHGASIKSFDNDELFYIITRGISEKSAKDIVARGFLEGTFGSFSKVKEQIKINKIDY